GSRFRIRQSGSSRRSRPYCRKRKRSSPKWLRSEKGRLLSHNKTPLTCQPPSISLTFLIGNKQLRRAITLSLLLEGKRAFVSGGTRGIGAAICEIFAREGADVAVNYHSSDELAGEVRKKIESHGRRALSFKVSVTDRFGMKHIA